MRALLGHLEPEDSLFEILFGLVMVLTFTLGAGVAAGQGTTEPQTLIYGAIGCNIAWGVIDAVFYLMGVLFVRGSRARLRRTVLSAKTEAAALNIIGQQLDPVLESITTEAGRRDLYREIHMRLGNSAFARRGIRRSDLIEAFVVFLLVLGTTIPAAVPFFFLNDPWIALRTSNFILVALLFFVGFRWARYTEANPWLVGTGLAAIGVSLVCLAIALGG